MSIPQGAASSSTRSNNIQARGEGVLLTVPRWRGKQKRGHGNVLVVGDEAHYEASSPGGGGEKLKMMDSSRGGQTKKEKGK